MIVARRDVCQKGQAIVIAKALLCLPAGRGPLRIQRHRIVLRHQLALRIEQMNEAARKSAEMIIADAEVKAEKIMNKASSRLAELHEDIIQLKGQRIQLEAQLRSIIEAHYKLFEMGKAQMKLRDEEYDKARMAKHTEVSSQ